MDFLDFLIDISRGATRAISAHFITKYLDKNEKTASNPMKVKKGGSSQKN